MDAGFGLGGHEVNIILPAGHDVGVQMVGDAGTGSAADVDPNIETVRVEGFFQQFRNLIDGVPEVLLFVVGEISQIGNFAVGNHEGVAGVVGETVEHGEDAFRTQEDEIGVVIAGLADGQEEFFPVFAYFLIGIVT